MQKIIKKTLCLLSIFLLSSFTTIAQSEDKIIGNWKDAEHPEKQVAMYKQDNKYFGKSINEQGKTAKNGIIVFKELVWNATTKTYQGVLVRPENGEEFKISVKLVNDNEFEFKVSKFFFSKLLTFKRIN